VSDGHAKLLPVVSVAEGDVAAGLHDAHGTGGQHKPLEIEAFSGTKWTNND
jgi:hypothetical protein